MKKTFATLAAASLFVSLVALPARAEPRHVACEVSGAVQVRPGLRTPSPDNLGAPYKVKIKGELTNCNSSDPTLESGEIEGTINGEGSCGHRAGEGEATVTWNNGNETTFTVKSTDEAALVVLPIETTESTEPAMTEGDHGVSIAILDADREECDTRRGARGATFEGHLMSGSPD